MRKKENRPCTSWILGAMGAGTVAFLMLLLGFAEHFPRIGTLTIALVAAFWVAGSLIWGAHLMQRSGWDDDLAHLVNFCGLLFSIVAYASFSLSAPPQEALRSML
ncbi:MAG: hypothetical protein ACYDC7_01700 [Acidithiobacillus ferrivorans]